MKIVVPSLDANIAAFGSQYQARDFYAAHLACTSTERFSPARLFLICRSIELAAKALHLDQGRTSKDIRKLSHNLLKACEPAILGAYQLVLTPAEMIELEKANDYYAAKGFEYVLFSAQGETHDRTGVERALSGWPNLPNEDTLRNVVNKLLTPKL